MIKISEVTMQKNESDFIIIREKAFKYFALSASVIDESVCIFLDNEKYIKDIRPNVTMIITTPFIGDMLTDESYGLCLVDNPRLLFFNLHNSLANHDSYKRQQKETSIGANCTISLMASISNTNVTIGNNVIIEEFVVIRDNTVIGDNSIIRAGTVIGGVGYEFKRTEKDISNVKHLGGVIIGKNVEIQYNSCVDKAVYPWDDTIIGDYTKIDNLVHIAHAVKIANNVMIVALSGIGGRTVIKENTWIGFGAIITNGIEVGHDSRANIGSVVTKSIPDYLSYSGNFAIEHNLFIRYMKKIVKESQS